MRVKEVIRKQSVTVEPFIGVDRIEEHLVNDGYVIVEDSKKQFYGLVTSRSLMQAGHNLVVDCLDECQPIRSSSSVGDAVHTMLKSNKDVLPVQEDDGSLVGAVRLVDLIDHLAQIQDANREIIIKNIYGTDDVEKAKGEFIREMFHNIKNPIQAILSSVHLLRDSTNEDERRALLNVISINTRQLDNLVDKLYTAYHTDAKGLET